jgi:hypothetical protein
MSSLCAPAPHALALSLLYVCATPAIREVINKTIERPTRSIRLKHWMNENKSNYKRHKHCQLSNLNPLQLSALCQLRRNKNVTIKLTDKNLGPAAMDTSEYIQQVLQEHLLTNAYKQLSFQEANNTMTQLKTFLKDLLSEQANTLPKSELTFFQRSLKEHHRLPVFYGLPKVHKQPISLRPVVSTSGSLLAIFPTWIDFKMKTLLPLIQSHVQNSRNVINELRDVILPSDSPTS